MQKRTVSPLYDRRMEHDSCGIGAVVNIDGRRDHDTVDNALKIVEKLEHRTGKNASGDTGDGVGIMLQISHRFFSAVAREHEVELGEPQDYAIGMIFFPQDPLARSRSRKLLEIILKKEQMQLLFWREVPTHPEILGSLAKSSMPYIMQCFIRRPDDVARGVDFDRRLYIARREYEQSVSGTYVVSLSSRTIVYKGMFLVWQLRRFFDDLQDERYESALALVHSRFSTNTAPSWNRAHPNRFILHNGEINTIRGNIDRMLAREETMSSPMLAGEMDKVFPVVNPNGSDSAMLDNTLEFLTFSGIPLPKAVMMTIPEPWVKDRNMSRSRRDMFHYYATMMEPWDGPAAVLFSDGELVGAVLDRNGLRPTRYYLLDTNTILLSSEVGVLDIPPERIVRKSRLMPGKMLIVDTVNGRLYDDREVKEHYAHEHPYGEWLDRELVPLAELPTPKKRVPQYTPETRNKLYKAFGYTYDDMNSSILPMAQNGVEPTAAMGADIPLAVLSEKHQPLFYYFKQMFAQVTNPPIDSMREEIVTDTTIYVGSDGNLLVDTAENCRELQINNPILTSLDMLKISELNMPGLKAARISILYYKNSSLELALDKLFMSCDKAFRSGFNIFILSDRGVDENRIAIPSLLAVSALQQYLVRTKKRTAVSIILESAEPRDVHHFAALFGFGASAVNPYLAQECIAEMVENGDLNKDPYAAINDYNKAILDGVIRIASKMGISSIQSYQGAQIFEAVGICRDVIDKYFTNTITRVGGIGLEEINDAVVWRHDQAFDPMDLTTDATIDSSGFHKLRSGPDKEDHMYNPLTILSLQNAVRKGSYEDFRQYSALVDDESVPHTLRGLFGLGYDRCAPVPLEEVEPVESIVKRFKTGAMSYGSISEEAHKCLAEAMNRLGGKSNSGEGGETPDRLGTIFNSAIKQVASGRFGVTEEYLVSAKEIQIKMAQGAKPGEGGHLPGSKVWPWIARTRYSTPGVSLISPPPHHDIYSIEDLAQLIYDLKCANKNAAIAVKLVSECGVGTIAAGVAKAGAQTVLISGYDGGTGAAPRNSIYNAGLPWELGVAEAHQTLMQNGLRSRVRLEADGKLMTGRDVAVACLLGAEEFGFATAPLVCLGCVMMRVCNLDTCPMGVATQRPELRKNFCGKPEHVMNFMTFVAMELREIMAKLGLRTIDEMVGRTDLLYVLPHQITERAAMVDVSSILRFESGGERRFDEKSLYHFDLDKTADERVLMRMLDKPGRQEISLPITCSDRAFGTLFGAELTRRFGTSLEDDTYTVHCRGGAGQSFGAFIPKGLTLRLEGDSNDYFGKGLSGGRLVVFPDRESALRASENVIIGNVALYGATSGSAFIAGIAGERFCVRNSGATAVAEGTGDHGCEYMTGGTVVILGSVGRNFAAGMSGGVAYVLDTEHKLYLLVNKELVSVETLSDKKDIQALRSLIRAHVEATGSEKGREILESFDEHLDEFKKIIPRDYSRMLERIEEFESHGLSREDAELEAFMKRGE
jgi:glutamate synthase (NADPH/NADH) large chain